MKKKKRFTRKSSKHSYKGKSGFEAGLVKYSAHPRNNIYLRLIGKNKHAEFDLTIDEAASIISVLGCAIMDYTHPKRDLLKPF